MYTVITSQKMNDICEVTRFTTTNFTGTNYPVLKTINHNNWGGSLLKGNFVSMIGRAHVGTTFYLILQIQISGEQISAVKSLSTG